MNNNDLDTTFRATDTRNKRVIEWIKVEDKLPEKEGWFIVCISDSIPFFFQRAYFENDMFELFVSAIKSNEITHWASIEGLVP